MNSHFEKEKEFIWRFPLKSNFTTNCKSVEKEKDPLKNYFVIQAKELLKNCVFYKDDQPVHITGIATLKDPNNIIPVSI